MRYEKRVEIAAPAQVVWDIMSDVARWPSWTPTMTSVEIDGPLVVGCLVTISQPGMQPATYIVDNCVEGKGFSWRVDGGGMNRKADHRIEPLSTDRCVVTLSFAMTGWLGAVAGRMSARRIASMVDTEATSLAAEAERRS